MAFAGCRATKLSGAGSCAGADAHLERKRETENAKKKEQEELKKLAQQMQVGQTATRAVPHEEYVENRRLIGDDGRLYDKVQQVIEDHGGKPGKD